MSEETKSSDSTSLETRPGILFIGSSNVGKRTLLSRLLSIDFEDALDSSNQVFSHGWSIDTKYYTADVSLWMAHLHEGFSIGSLPIYNKLAALVMVFDLSDLSSFVALKGLEFDEFGISEIEGSSLLGDEEEPSREIKRSHIEWCTKHGIEYIEACASNVDFDKCLLVDGDSQGVERLYGALSAHMWPGMILKSDNRITLPTLPDKEEISDEESDYELEYEVLSGGSAEPWDDTYGGWVSANGRTVIPDEGGSVTENNYVKECENENREKLDREEMWPSSSASELQGDKNVVPDVQEPCENGDSDEVTPFEFEDLEQLMSEIGSVRDNLRLMPDFQRREMAANLAMKMAAMFGGGSDDDVEVE
ncbi:hypothetical protein OIU77_024835 [Salix suchowensis]|uniref:Alpha/gamma-adaptin-binding protein p34 n=1 Tax=Salix suchowensis TaxID=1278906 RepID=A0ABQ9BUY5_9ROSI|nr:hypothetical protein OIU77_024835 [Salix suchowensis]